MPDKSDLYNISIAELLDNISILLDFMLELAVEAGGVIISNDKFRNFQHVPAFRPVTEDRFVFFGSS